MFPPRRKILSKFLPALPHMSLISTPPVSGFFFFFFYVNSFFRSPCSSFFEATRSLSVRASRCIFDILLPFSVISNPFSPGSKRGFHHFGCRLSPPGCGGPFSSFFFCVVAFPSFYVSFFHGSRSVLRIMVASDWQ